MGFGLNRRIVVGKIESTPGTAEFNLTSTFPADADHNNRFVNIEMTPDIGMDDEMGDVATGDDAELESYAGIQQGEVSMECPVVWGGAVATAPEWAAYARACGLEQNAYTTVGIGYYPLAENNCVSMTIAVFDVNCSSGIAKGYLFKGCVGDWSISATLGGVWKWKFSFKGAYVGDQEVDVSSELPALTSPSAETPEKLLSNTVSILGVTQLINQFELVGGNDIKYIPDQSDATGIKQFYLSGKKRPRLSMNAVMNPIATEDVFTKVTGETTGTGTITGPNITLALPRLQMLTAAQGDIEGMVGYSHNLKCLRNSNGVSSGIAALDNEATLEILQGARA